MGKHVKTMKLEIYKFAEGDKARRAVWKELSEQCQVFTNRVWQKWQVWHCTNGSREILAKWLADAKAWHELPKKTRGKKPPFPLQPIPNELSKELSALSHEFPTLHARTKTLLVQAISQGIKTRKAANGSLPGWINILMCREAVPSFTYPLPIRFDSQAKAPQATLIEPANKKDNWKLRIRVERIDQEGRGGSIQEDCQLLTKRNKTLSLVRTLEKIARDPRYKLCGSQLSYQRGKWFVLLTYSWESTAPELDEDKTAVLLPGRDDPWLLKINGKLFYRGGRGIHVGKLRNMVSGERRDRQDHYRWAGAATKGHGRDRATASWRKLETRWREYVKRYNHSVTTAIVKECVASGVGSLEYWQPKDDRRDSRFLASSGVDENSRGVRSSWDFFQVKTLLEYKCNAAGVKFSCREFGVRPKRAVTSAA